MNCERCGGSGWLLVQRGGREGVKSCPCRSAKVKAASAGKPLTVENAAAWVEVLCDVLAFAPKTKAGRALIATALWDMCETSEAAQWVVERACQLYSKWDDCGLPGLRQILCSRYQPKDGIELSYSLTYPEGIPAEKRLPEFPKLALPSGHQVSADSTLDCLVVDSAAQKRIALPELSSEEQKAADAFRHVLEDIITAPQDRPCPPPSRRVRLAATAPLRVDQPQQPLPPGRYAEITLVDIERAIALKPDRREAMVAEARATLTDPAATRDRKQIAREVLRGFGEDENVDHSVSARLA